MIELNEIVEQVVKQIDASIFAFTAEAELLDYSRKLVAAVDAARVTQGPAVIYGERRLTPKDTDEMWGLLTANFIDAKIPVGTKLYLHPAAVEAERAREQEPVAWMMETEHKDSGEKCTWISTDKKGWNNMESVIYGEQVPLSPPLAGDVANQHFA